MPIYEYRCRKCGNEFELIQKLSDPPPEGCPKCEGEVEKLISAPSFQLKGSGWYLTDYAGKGSSPSSGEGKSESSKSSDSSSSGKSDGGTGTKGETKS